MKELPESGSVRYPLSPTLLRTLSHSPVPAAAISETLARHPEFSPRQKSLDWNRFDAGPTIRDTKGNRRAPRKRSESIGSLRSLQQTTAFPAYRRSSTTSLDPPIRSVSNPIPTAPNSHTSQNDAATNSSNLADLSWGKWWPFAIVEPEAGTTSKSDPSSPDSILATRSFLELFAGKGVTSEAEQQRLMQKELDEAEGELLKLDLDELRIASQDLPSTPPPAVLPPRPIPLRHSSSRQYLPTTTFSSGSTVAPHPPFSPLLSPSLMSPPGSPSGVRRAAHHGRHYSSGPGTSRKEVDGFLDEEDKKRAKLEEEQGMDMFDLIRERYRCPLHPIVFCHGLFGTSLALIFEFSSFRFAGFDVIGPANFKPLQFSYWIGVKEALEAMGVEVLVGRVPASAGIEERAKVLAELIEQTFPGREINLIGHSMVRSALIIARMIADWVWPDSGWTRCEILDFEVETDDFQDSLVDDYRYSASRILFRRLSSGGCDRQDEGSGVAVDV